VLAPHEQDLAVLEQGDARPGAEREVWGLEGGVCMERVEL